MDHFSAHALTDVNLRKQTMEANDITYLVSLRMNAAVEILRLVSQAPSSGTVRVLQVPSLVDHAQESQNNVEAVSLAFFPATNSRFPTKD